MKQILIILSLLCLFASSCTKETLILMNDSSNSSLQTRAELSESYDALYYESAGFWIKPQEDPYNLENYRRAAEALNVDASQITPTHHAVVIYPRNEYELNDILSRSDVKSSFIPFGYTLAPEEQQGEANRKNEQVFQPETKYFCGDVVMPALYVVWPVSIAIPKKYDYRIAYEVYLPDYSLARDEQETDSIFALERMAIQLAGGVGCNGQSNSPSRKALFGHIMDLDSVLNTNIPVENARIRVQYGTNIIDAYSAANGYFTITGTINDNATVSVLFENDRWRIALNSLISYSLSLGTVSGTWGASTIHHFTTNFDYMPIHRGANYFFHGAHDITTPSCNYAIRINMSMNSSSGTYFCLPSLIFTPYIVVSDFDLGFDGLLVSDICHELGHFQHYLIVGSDNSTYNSTISFIKESYAVYTSWYLSREYYQLLNASSFNTNWEYSLGSDYKTWTSSSSIAEYSPIFIDLVDDNNQALTLLPNYYYNNDPISGCPHSFIESAATSSESWDDLYDLLEDAVGSYYTSDEFQTFIAPYVSYFQ